MALYDRILVPLDGTPVDEPCSSTSSELAAACEATVVLLRVAHYHTRDTAHARGRGRREDAGARRGAPRRAGLRGRDGAGAAASRPRRSSRRRDELRADLIAMATHGHGGATRLVLGSVADHVRHNTRVPLLLVKGGTASPEG